MQKKVRFTEKHDSRIGRDPDPALTLLGTDPALVLIEFRTAK